jgi:hypothetical protein
VWQKALAASIMRKMRLGGEISQKAAISIADEYFGRQKTYHLSNVQDRPLL